MARQYGLPYKGSKNKIAKQIVDFLPAGGALYDLFAGGCAVTHAAMEAGKWSRYVVNDIEPGIVQLFVDAVNGKYHNENRWISRDMFELLKGSDPYVRYCWSFGNNGKGYLYAPEIERFKKHLHKMFFAGNPHDARLAWKGFVREFALVREEIGELTGQVEQLCKECGVELLRNQDGTVNAKQTKKDVLTVLSGDIRKYLRDALKASGHTAADVDELLGTNGMAGHYFGASQWMLPTEEAYKKMQTIMPGLTVPWATLHERLERLERLESLQSFSMDYRDIEIPPDAVIYCDIPYKGTDRYNTDFDHDSFYDWACSQSVPIFISEYNMPEDRFECVLEMAHTCSLSATATNKVTERIFTPKH